MKITARHVQHALNACNNVLTVVQPTHEIVYITLQELYCLPRLSYSALAMCLDLNQARCLDICWNMGINGNQ